MEHGINGMWNVQCQGHIEMLKAVPLIYYVLILIKCPYIMQLDMSVQGSMCP